MPKRPARKIRHFVLGQDLGGDGHTRVTRGENFLVHGGTEKSHDLTVDIVSLFSKKLNREAPSDIQAVKAILDEVLRKKGCAPRPRDPKKPE